MRLFYQIMDRAEAFNCGEPVIVDCQVSGLTMEEIDYDIGNILKHWAYAGYWVLEDDSDVVVKSKDFDYKGFWESWYGG